MAPAPAEAKPDWASVDKLLASQSYIGGGDSATQEDFAKFTEFGGQPPESFVNAVRWWSHIRALAQRFPLRKWPKAAAPAQAGPKDQANLERVLVGATQGKVVTRFPPEPSGYLHIGHAKAALLNYTYALMYGGKCLLRFDDTNPTKEKMEYQQSIVEDLKLLEIEHEPVTYSSDYFALTESLMEKMIKEGKAYADDTSADVIKEERLNRVCSKCRDAPVEKSLKLWKEMLAGTEVGQNCCIRGKIDMQSDNACMRDPVFYRCKVDEPHHRHGNKYKAYPTYDFCCAVIDSHEGVSHALRSLEYSDRAAMYHWVLQNTGYKHVELTEFSRMNFDYTVLSKRKLTLLVQKGIVSGWDDPRMPTVRGVLRRGLTVDALKEFVMTQGASRNTNSMSWDKIWAINKQKIDPVIPRYCGIEESNLVELTLSDGPKTPTPKQENLHPKDPAMGTKEMFMAGKIYLRQEDCQVLTDGEEVTLMHWGNAIVDRVEREDGKAKRAVGHLHLEGNVKSTKYKLNWLPVMDGLLKITLRELDYLFLKPTFEEGEDPMDFVNPRSLVDTPALGEPAMKALKKGDKLQLERGGYYIVDQADPLILIEIPSGRAKKVSGEVREQPPAAAGKEKGGKKATEAAPAQQPGKADAAPKAKAEPKAKADAKAKAKAGAKDRPLDDVTRVDIRVGKIEKVWPHPEADKLWCEEINIGKEKPLTVCSGLRDHYSQDQMQGARVILIANMKPRNMRGVPSQGMVLCATSSAGKVELLAPPEGAKVGERITMDTFEGEPDEVLQDKSGKAPLEVIKPDMATNASCEATFRGKTWMTSAGPVRCPTNSSSPIG